MKKRITKIIGGLTVGRKLALIYFLDLTAVIFISGILIHEKFIAINFSNKEIVGNQYIAEVREALIASVDPASDKAKAVAHAQAILDAEKKYGDEMGSNQLAETYAKSLRASHIGHETLTQSDDSFAQGRALLTRIGNQSNLILDPDLDSYYTMSLIVLRFPELLELLDRTGDLASQLPKMYDENRQVQQTRFLILEGRLDATTKGIQSDYDEAFAASQPMLQLELEKSRNDLLVSIQRFRIASQAMAGIIEVDESDSDYLQLRIAAIRDLKVAWIAAEQQMHRLLEDRIAEAYSRMWQHLGTAALLLMVILSLVFFVARQIALPIRNLARVADNVSRSGDYSLRSSWDSSDEIGRLVNGFNGMLQQLDQQRIAQQEMVAQTRAAQAQHELVEAIPIPLMVTSIPDHAVLHANDAARAWLGGRDENPWKTGMLPALRARFFQRLHDTDTVDEFEVRWTGGEKPSWALVSARCLDYQGQPAVLTTFTPINHMKYMERRLELWAKVFEASSESIVIIDASGRIVTVNRAFSRNTGYELHELIGKYSMMLLSNRNQKNFSQTLARTASTKGSWQGEMWISRKDGESYPAWLVLNAVRDKQGEIQHYIAMSLDISERKANEQRIHYLAHHDVLTALPNRFLFDERLQMAIQQAKRAESMVAVLFIDLDRFKNINDSMGHHIGDGLLISVARRLVDTVREGDTVSRMGGDEFVIILNNVESAEEVGKLVEQRMIPRIQQAHMVDGMELYISCSIGIALFPDDGDDIDLLMRHADSAMYQAKESGRNNAQFFTAELNDRVVKRMHLESDLRHAVERNELVLYYQPRINAMTGRLAGVESLVRWEHPTEGMILPANFIPVSEESGLIVPIGAWIIREAMRQHVEWKASGFGEIPVSINLSAVQLKEGGLLKVLEHALKDIPADARNIELELTESILMDNVPATIQMLEQIKALGFSLSIDDFGTGYSSLNYLYQFPIDRLKIDKSFVQNIHISSHNLAVTNAIIGLGHTLGLHVVAEGVELEQDVHLLCAAGCDELQGYYFGKPMPAEQFEIWLKMERDAAESEPGGIEDSAEWF